ncbi:hypothetical protein [Bradyrhizobium sp. TM239]|uniref:hypothetical protein n=1 Tax=Bradyrhizobium sp. TM239 TaxID=2599802 RepID=UPI0030C664F4
MRAGLFKSGLVPFGLAGALVCGSASVVSSLPAESFSRGQDIPLSRTFVAQCIPLPCVLLGNDPVRVGALVKQEHLGGALDTSDVICNPAQPTPLDINKEDAIDRAADDQDLFRLFHETEKSREIIDLIKSFGHDVRWIASSVISESMVDVKQVRRALAAIPSECRKRAVSRGLVTSIRSRKFGILSLTFRITSSGDADRKLDKLGSLLRETFELTVQGDTISLYSKQARLFSVQTTSVDSFLKAHPKLQ